MNLTHFGEQFVAGVLERVYPKAIYPAFVNRDYEGEIKKPGDRVNILSFLNDTLLSDYVVGTNMASETIIDEEDQLVVEKRKYYNFSLDRLEDLFTYANNVSSALLDNQAIVLAKETDTYVFNKWGEEAKAGNWIGMDLKVDGMAGLGIGTMASVLTTATGGTLTIQLGTDDMTNVTPVECSIDGLLYNGGFEASDLFKGVRLRSTAALVSPWWRISGVTNSVAVTITEWDEAVAGSDFAEGQTLRGVFGGDGRSFPRYGTGEAMWVGAAAGVNFGWEVQAAIATTITAATIYDQTTLLAQVLDENDVPAENRHIGLPPSGITMLRQCAETQPTGVAEIYTGTVINGRVARFGAFDVHNVTGARLSTRAGRNIGAGAGATMVLTPSPVGTIIPACHPSFMTYADKWSESRVVDMENQFAKAYQGLFLFGAKVPHQRRKAGAVLFAAIA
uniref:Putative capsid protein n=1 Tax=viral metagenome TaxID=1070528 RepID=A0A6M3JV44_9ZZZZ